MTDLIALARQAGAVGDRVHHLTCFNPKQLEEFADLVRADERERCEKACRTVSTYHSLSDPAYIEGKQVAKTECILAIRARTTK